MFWGVFEACLVGGNVCVYVWTNSGVGTFQPINCLQAYFASGGKGPTPQAGRTEIPQLLCAIPHEEQRRKEGINPVGTIPEVQQKKYGRHTQKIKFQCQRVIKSGD